VKALGWLASLSLARFARLESRPQPVRHGLRAAFFIYELTNLRIAMPQLNPSIRKSVNP
jgi:hypothetical protein